jgi:DNA-binding GntR family transcriptional regulator
MSNSEKVYRKIKELIFNGRIKPGERLVETELCEKFKISRTPVREALKRLSSEKFIKIVPNKGAQIAKLTLEEIIEIQEFRMLIETKCIAEYSENFTAKNIDQMIKLNEEMKNNIKNMDILRFVENNALFHSVFVNISKNKIIAQVFRDLQYRYNPHQYFTLTFPGALELSIKGHNNIIECFIKKDFKKAALKIREHYEDFLPIYKKIGEFNPW